MFSDILNVIPFRKIEGSCPFINDCNLKAQKPVQEQNTDSYPISALIFF